MNFRWRLAWVVPPMMALTALAAVAEGLQRYWYAVTTETGMPHLEENLRYTVTHEKRCIAREDLSRLFPVLSHPALHGCQLQDEREEQDGLSYRLACSDTHSATGQAMWRLDSNALRGVLNIRLGGKNMTFYQRITALRLGPCAS